MVLIGAWGRVKRFWVELSVAMDVFISILSGTARNSMGAEAREAWVGKAETGMGDFWGWSNG
jgi:hypothetical protein